MSQRTGSCSRAGIADPAPLILDEATSTIAQADQIAVVEEGRIVESGTLDGLRARGRFAELFDRWLAGAA